MFGVAVIVLVIAALKINRSGKNLGFPTTRKKWEKFRRRKARNG
jgi:hypothetical protein